MKRIALFFVSMCLCFLMAFTVFAAETEKGLEHFRHYLFKKGIR